MKNRSSLAFTLAALGMIVGACGGSNDDGDVGGSGGAPAGAGGSVSGSGGEQASTTGGPLPSGSSSSQSTAGGSDASGSATSGGAPAGGGGETAGGNGGSGGDGGGGGQVNRPEVVLAGDNVNANGPLETTVQDLSFSGGGHILVRPTTLTTEPNKKHPVAIWGPGGGTPPRDYLQLLTRMASHGFVLVGIRESTGDAVLMSAAIDWLEAQDADQNSPMYGRLILDRVGVFGHSMGGLSSEAAAQTDKRVSTALLDNSGSFEHNALVNLKIPVGIIYGETGQEAPNAEGDFNNAGNKGPVWLGKMKGGGHGSGPWDGAGANVAWMRWHLGGENSRKDAFLKDGGDYNNKGVWQTQSKNWNEWKNWNE
ncbi:poly(ethylene terephthalate) hydrolase family protein [Sorangium sp. So ce117]|uniref:poly(ethylene terephthalate) hydrolase family protein n=1 Tax=Sorangium sp. So ce117 TaxID=3133277 RepID=UPI003F6114C2